MNKEIVKIAKKLKNEGGRAFLVGGSVRDQIMGFEPKDFDIEVFGIDLATLINALSEFGRVDVVGQSFGVVKLTTEENDFDFSLPRKDSKVAEGHKGFKVKPDPNMTIEDAQRRRDFTINGLSMDVLTGEVIDNFGGLKDIELHILRVIDPITFKDDPLRVLRGFQFAGRFDLIASVHTSNFCWTMLNEFDSLPKERIWGEWFKWASKSIKPSRGLDFLLKTGWLSSFPEIKEMIWVKQEPDFHPEGTVMVHTAIACDKAAEFAIRDGLNSMDRAVAVFAALCHDMGKPVTTIVEDGVIKSPNHDVEGEEIARSFMNRIGAPKDITDRVCEIVRNHMHHINFKNKEISVKAARRFANRFNHATMDDMKMIFEVDHSARPPLPEGLPEEARKLIELATVEIENGSIEPIVMGRHLIEKFGMKPGKHFGEILKAAFEAQLDCEFDNLEDGLKWLVTNKFV